MQITNSYEDRKRAEAYSKLEFPRTYHLAYRDLPQIIESHVEGRKAIDFGCGTGRSTRFLKKLGFDTIGVDISDDMVRLAREYEAGGDYRVIEDGDFSQFQPGSFDLIQSIFTFDNIPTMEKKLTIFEGMGHLLTENGKIINLVSSPDMYVNEWASFSTKDFPRNKQAKSGDKVLIIITDIDDARPVEDVVWSDEDYRKVYREAGLQVVATYRPLAHGDEPYQWVNETHTAPWVIYVLNKM